MLAEALVQEYARPIYRLGFAVLGDPGAAMAATRAAFTAALLNVYRYRSTSEVASWLYANVLPALRDERRRRGMRGLLQDALPGVRRRTEPWVSGPVTEVDERLWRGLDGLGEAVRLAVLLRYVAGLDVTDVARLVERDARQVQGYLEAARRKAVEAVGRAAEPGADRPLEELDALVERSLGMRWPVPDVTGEDLHALAAEVVQHTIRQEVQRKKFTRLKEIAVMGVIILVGLGALVAANFISPEPELTAPLRGYEYLPRTGGVESGSGDRSGAPAAPTEITPTPVPSNAFYTVEPGDTLESIAGKLNTSVKYLQSLNRLPGSAELVAGQKLLIPFILAVKQRPTTTPLPALEMPTPLALDASEEEILQRMNQTGVAWDTLWADARLISYLPDEVSFRSPEGFRAQFWFSANQALVLHGLPGGSHPEAVFLWANDRLYRSQPGDDQPWFSELGQREMINDPFLQNMGEIIGTLSERGQRAADPLHQEVVGSDWVAGQKALVIDQRNETGELVARAWLDAQSGFILRKQFLAVDGSKAGGTVLKEFLVSGIALNVDFPQALFDPQLPWRGGFAKDHSGRPVEESGALEAWQLAGAFAGVPFEPVPAGFDPAHSQLTFRFRDGFNPYRYSSRPFRPVADIFAGRYLLGSANLGLPESILCDRSPDGWRIAITASFSDRWPRPHLRWFDLADVNTLHNPVPRVHVQAMAFAPDSRRLAFFGDGVLYVLDTGTGELTRLLELEDARSLAWSPQGDFLALIGPLHADLREEVIVVGVENRAIVYRNVIDNENGRAEAGWPVLEWGIPFPVEPDRLEACKDPR